MDPIKINVNVEVGLKQTTIEALAALFARPCAPGFDPLPAPTTEEKPQPEPKRQARKPEPAPEPEAPAQTHALTDDDNLPPPDAPAPQKSTPNEDDARKAVKAARDRGVPAKTIKDYMMTTFGIASSVECPAERRQELIDGLNRLAA